jgi:hypothetical protein
VLVKHPAILGFWHSSGITLRIYIQMTLGISSFSCHCKHKSNDFFLALQRMLREHLILKFGRRRLWTNFKVLYLRSPGRTEENPRNLNQDSMSPGPRLEPWTSRMRSRSVYQSTKTFGWALDKGYRSRRRKWPNERLHIFYSNSDIVRVIKSRYMI